MSCNLIFDFGALFVAYLRGVVNTFSFFFFEVIYDYTGVAAFFTRLFVQAVRIILTFVVYCTMHDEVILHAIPLCSQVRAIRFEKRFALLDLRYVLFLIFFVIAFPARCGY
jgi:hypothetical protein